MIPKPDSPFLQRVSVGLRILKRQRVNELSFETNLNAALCWIQRAYYVVGESGISKGYDLLRNRWSPPYPETTGYTIPTLFNAAKITNRYDYCTLALNLAGYLLGTATPEGGVAHWQSRINDNPVVFDTGQVIFGWLAAFEYCRDERYLLAAIRAGDWLISIQDPSGSWRSNQFLGVEKVIDTRVAWALLELNHRVNKESYVQAAIRNLKWAQTQQDPNGWFKHCAFVEGKDPFTHTLAYAAEGFYECGSILHEASYIEVARLTADALLKHQRYDGSLASTFGPGMCETSRSSCLTGDCQLGCLWLRLFELTHDQVYFNAAKSTITFVARTQLIDEPDVNICGGIPGSYPIYGVYERLKYPNWATKFFIDALLRLGRINSKSIQSFYVG